MTEVSKNEPPGAVSMPCSVCGALMQEVAQVPAFGEEPELIAFECPKCGHVESILRRK